PRVRDPPPTPNTDLPAGSEGYFHRPEYAPRDFRAERPRHRGHAVVATECVEFRRAAHRYRSPRVCVLRLRAAGRWCPMGRERSGWSLADPFGENKQVDAGVAVMPVHSFGVAAVPDAVLLAQHDQPNHRGHALGGRKFGQDLTDAGGAVITDDSVDVGF